MNSARRTRISAKAIYAVTLIVAIAFSISAHAQSAKKPSSSGGAKEKLIGTWHLVHIDAPDPDGKFVPILQPKGMLIYNGAIDDRATTDVSDVAGAKNYVSQALQEAMAGKAISVATSRPYGCAVKYKD